MRFEYIIWNYIIEMSSYDSGSTAWVMASSITVSLMAPGISLFYGGLVNKKNLLSIIGFSFLIFSTATITWGLVGFSLAFGRQTLASGFIGDCTYCGFRYISDTFTNPFSFNIAFPAYFFLEMLQTGVAAVILVTPFIGRLRTIYLILISIAYQLIIYSPITYWIRNPNGWLNRLGAIDFSGGNMIHLTSGFASAAIMYMIGRDKNQIQYQNSTSTFSTLMGSTLIWFSSFGFNGAAALVSGTSATVAMINTQLAAAGGALGWGFIQFLFTDRGKVGGWCSGIICGVVSITPCSGFVSLWSSTVIGAISAIIVYIFCHVYSNEHQELPDTLGIFSAHGIAAFWGVLCAGAFSTKQSGNIYEGLFYGGEAGGRLFGVQMLCALVCSVYAFTVMIFIHFLTLRLVEPMLTEQEQEQGLDSYSHVQENDPLDEEDLVNIIKTLNSYTELNKLMQSTYEQPQQPKYRETSVPKKAKNKKKRQQEPLPSRQKLIERLSALDRAKQNEMIEIYEKMIKMKQNDSRKS